MASVEISTNTLRDEWVQLAFDDSYTLVLDAPGVGVCCHTVVASAELKFPLEPELDDAVIVATAR